MEKLDADHDGRIDFSEFCTAAQDTVKAANEENLERVFMFFDLDGDGVISYSEMEEIFSKMANSRSNLREIWDKICK